MMYGWGNMFGAGGFLMGLSMLAFWVLVIAGIVLAIRALSRNTVVETQKSEPRALGILKERYAKGEISADEYESMRRDLAE